MAVFFVVLYVANVNLELKTLILHLFSSFMDYRQPFSTVLNVTC